MQLFSRCKKSEWMRLVSVYILAVDKTSRVRVIRYIIMFPFLIQLFCINEIQSTLLHTTVHALWKIVFILFFFSLETIRFYFCADKNFLLPSTKLIKQKINKYLISPNHIWTMQIFKLFKSFWCWNDKMLQILFKRDSMTDTLLMSIAIKQPTEVATTNKLGQRKVHTFFFFRFFSFLRGTHKRICLDFAADYK